MSGLQLQFVKSNFHCNFPNLNCVHLPLLPNPQHCHAVKFSAIPFSGEIQFESFDWELFQGRYSFMAKNLIQRPLIFQDENSDIYLKKGVISGKSKTAKLEGVKKGTAGLKSRNALSDITNKSTAPPEEAAKKKSLQKEIKIPSDFNIAEETFLHDHRKCTEAQKSASTPKHFLDLVLPRCDSASSVDISKTEMGTSDEGMDSSLSYFEPEELPMSEFPSWLRFSWKSPPSSPKNTGSPPLSPFEWEFEPIEFTLKEEINC